MRLMNYSRHSSATALRSTKTFQPPMLGAPHWKLLNQSEQRRRMESQGALKRSNSI
jgi:hypothetical protein